VIGDGEVSGGRKDQQREDGSEVVLGTFACTTQGPQAIVVVITSARSFQGGGWPILGDS
jgi:hypothetical protein